MPLDIDLLDYALLALRCLLVYNIEEQVGNLYLIHYVRILNNLADILRSVPPGHILSNITVSDIAALYRRRGIVEDVIVTRAGKYLTVEIVGCRIAREVHRLMKRQEHACPLLMPLILAVYVNYGPYIRLAEYPMITTDGALARFELTSQF